MSDYVCHSRALLCPEGQRYFAECANRVEEKHEFRRLVRRFYEQRQVDQAFSWAFQLGLDDKHPLVAQEIQKRKIRFNLLAEADELMYQAICGYRTLNLTPHDIVVVDSHGAELRRYPKSNYVVRVTTQEQKPVHSYDNVPTVRAQRFVDLEFSPADFDPAFIAQYDGVIVSMPVGQMLQDKSRRMRDRGAFESVVVLGPDTGPDGVVRDENGSIVGTKRLVCYN